MRRHRMGRQFLGSSIARSAMAGLFREMVDAFSANRRAVVAPELAAIRAALEKAGVELTDGDEPGVRLPLNWTRSALVLMSPCVEMTRATGEGREKAPKTMV